MIPTWVKVLPKGMRYTMIGDEAASRRINRVGRPGQITVWVYPVGVVQTDDDVADTVAGYIDREKLHDAAYDTTVIGIKVVNGILYLGHAIDEVK